MEKDKKRVMEQQQFRTLKRHLDNLTLSQLNEIDRLIKNANRQQGAVELSEEERQFIHGLFTKETSTPSYS
ncbi:MULTISPECIES: hypothetical protein [Vibrio]|uniref:hypothetical protein n=1 Tax=Vibrio TaxID=662 RepID=UPI001D12F7F6|nr:MULTISPECIES: hypothetical protein [Vibrio]